VRWTGAARRREFTVAVVDAARQFQYPPIAEPQTIQRESRSIHRRVERSCASRRLAVAHKLRLDRLTRFEPRVRSSEDETQPFQHDRIHVATANRTQEDHHMTKACTRHMVWSRRPRTTAARAAFRSAARCTAQMRDAERRCGRDGGHVHRRRWTHAPSTHVSARLLACTRCMPLCTHLCRGASTTSVPLCPLRPQRQRQPAVAPSHIRLVSTRLDSMRLVTSVSYRVCAHACVVSMHSHGFTRLI
jgi:hypothetical protein